MPSDQYDETVKEWAGKLAKFHDNMVRESIYLGMLLSGSKPSTYLSIKIDRILAKTGGLDSILQMDQEELEELGFSWTQSIRIIAHARLAELEKLDWNELRMSNVPIEILKNRKE